MTTFSINTIFFRLNDETSQISNFSAEKMEVFTSARNAKFSYAPYYSGSDDDWPDVNFTYPDDLRMTRASGASFDHAASEGYLGYMDHAGGRTQFIMLEVEVSEDVYDVAFFRIGGAALPSIQNVSQLVAFVQSLETTGGVGRVSSGVFGPNKDIAMTALARAGLTENDDLLGDSGAEVFRVGIGHDTVNGAGGNDTIFGGAGNDSLSGAAGADSIQGDDGNDRLSGGGANDRLFGNAGNDSLFGELGNDYLAGGLGRDLLNGGAGRDTLAGGAGNDRLNGGAGIDYFDFRAATTGGGAFGQDTIIGYQAGEKIDLRGHGLGVGEAVTVAGDDRQTVITTAGEGVITLQGVAFSSFDADAILL